MNINPIQKSLVEYFNRSEQFYFFLAHPTFEIHWMNPLLSAAAAIDSNQLSSIFDAASLSELRNVFLQLKACPEKVMHLDAALRCGEKLEWEFTTLPGQELLIQAVGTPTRKKPQDLAQADEIHPERYEAFEQSAEGLWMFETKEPIPANAGADEIMAYWRKNAYLAECNDNMARMYGFLTARELIGTKLEELMSFDDPSWVDYMKEFIRKGFRSMGAETKEYDRYGNAVYFINNMRGVVEDGMLKRVWGTQQDITEQKLAVEKALYLAKLVETVTEIIISEDANKRIVSWNKAAEQSFGYAMREVYGRSIEEVLSIKFRDHSFTTIREILELQGEWMGEARVIAKSGKEVPVQIAFTPIINERGERSGYVTVSRDITEKLEAEKKLKESELFYRNLIADSIDGMLLTDENGLISFASPSIKKILGYDPEEPVGKILFEYGHPDDLELGMTTFQDELVNDPQVKFISIRLKKKSGEWLWCIVRGHNLLDNPYVGKMVIYFSDDTRRKNAEEALLQSEERSRYRLNILNNVTDLIVTTDMDRKITSWNKVVEKLTGIEQSYAIGKRTVDLAEVSYHPFTHDQVAEIVKREGIWRGELHFTGADGMRRHILHTVSLFYDDKGEEIGFLGVGKDITERVEAEKRLQESEAFYRSLISYSLDGIVLTDEQGRVTYSAPSVHKMIGYYPEQLLGKSVFDFIHPEDDARAKLAFQLELQKASIDDYISLRLRKATGEWNWFAVRAHNLLDNPGVNGFIVYFTDDSGRRASAEKMREKQRQLTQATIDGQEKERQEIGKELHDNINQHLTTTRLYLEVAQEKAEGDVREMIGLSHKTLVGIIDEIRRMSQSLIPPTLGDLGLVESISDLCDALKRAHTFQVEFYNRHFSEENLPSNVKLMLFRIIQEQISNIIRHSAASRIQIKLQSDAEYLILTVSDNGKGFDRKHVKRGLGFTNIFNRAGLFNGTMEVESAPGKGCTLTLIFPVSTYYTASAS